MKLKGSCHCQSVSFECESNTPYPYMQCYCSICRKTAGGGGYAINIMGIANTLKVKGKQFISIYQARLTPSKKSKSKVSPGQRHFCKKCASCLWMFDPRWSSFIYPFASAIDTKLPKPPKDVCIMLDSSVDWCDVPTTKKADHFKKYPELSIEDWHHKNKLWVK